MKRGKHASEHRYFFSESKSGKHASYNIKIFGVNKRGKHAKDELIVYNPLYAKFTTCLGAFAVATSLFTLATLSKYKGTLASTDTARVAKYVIELTKTEETITEILPTSTTDIEFEVRNYTGAIENPDDVLEVKSKYKIILDIIDTLDLPIEYHLYRVYGPSNEVEITLTSGESQYINMDTTTASHKYRLELIWQNGYDSIIYQSLSDHIRISIDSEQID